MGGRGELFFQKKKTTRNLLLRHCLKKEKKKEKEKEIACAIHSGVTVSRSRRNGTPTALNEQEERNLSGQ